MNRHELPQIVGRGEIRPSIERPDLSLKAKRFAKRLGVSPSLATLLADIENLGNKHDSI